MATKQSSDEKDCFAPKDGARNDTKTVFDPPHDWGRENRKMLESIKLRIEYAYCYVQEVRAYGSIKHHNAG